MAAINEDTYTRLSRAIVSAQSDSYSLRDGLIKISREQGMNADQVRRLVERTNTVAHLEQFQNAKQASRNVVFEAVDPEDVLRGIGAAAPADATKTAAVVDLAFEVEARILGDEGMFRLSPGQEKTASAADDVVFLWPGTLEDLEEAHAYEQKLAAVKTAREAAALHEQAVEHLASARAQLNEDATMLYFDGVKLAASLLRGNEPERQERIDELAASIPDAGTKLATLAAVVGREFPVAPATPASAPWEVPAEAGALVRFAEKRAELLRRGEELDELAALVHKRA